MKKVYLIGIWWIGMSALARYYLSIWYVVIWSDTTTSKLIEDLQKEGAYIALWEHPGSIDESFEWVVYSEAIDPSHPERISAVHQKVPCLSYPQALGEITKNFELVSIAGTHGKSTTTAMLSLILKETSLNFFSIVGTLVPEFWGKNFFTRKNLDDNECYFILESCEYKESFLNYRPKIWVVTNIEADHLDYYKNIDNYIEAFQKFLSNIRPWGFAVINMEDDLSKKLKKDRTDISYVEMYHDYYLWCGESYNYRNIQMQIPGDHILTDAKLAYVAWFLCNAKPEEILSWLHAYKGTWRRMEIVGITPNKNILMSDYGHHPTEILVTTKAIKERYPDKKLFCIFQPHQYSRTLELLEDFKKCFSYCDTVVIPNIYASRDTKENMEKISAQSFVEQLSIKNKVFWNGLENTLSIIKKYDLEEPGSSVILLMGAWDIDGLRTQIWTIK